MERLQTLLTHPAVLVGLGGAIGANLRYWSGVYAARWLGTGYPWGTLAVNVLGSFLLGLVAARFVNPQSAWRLLLGVGLCGGFTTFSTFSVETLLMLKSGRHLAAISYVSVSVFLGFVAALGGYRLASD